MMVEVYQFEWIVFVFGFFDEFVDVGYVVDFVEYVQYCFVCVVMGWFLQGGDVGGDVGEWIGVGGVGQMYCGGGSVLFVVGVENEDVVYGFGQYGVDWFGFVGGVEYYVQEVFCVVQVVMWIYYWFVFGVFVYYGGDGWYFGDQVMCGDFVMFWVIDVQGVVVEG